MEETRVQRWFLNPSSATYQLCDPGEITFSKNLVNFYIHLIKVLQGLN